MLYLHRDRGMRPFSLGYGMRPLTLWRCGMKPLRLYFFLELCEFIFSSKVISRFSISININLKDGEVCP